MKKVGIIGFGRFGKVLADLLKKQYEVLIYDPNLKNGDNQVALEKVLESFLVFIAVPISEFKKVVQEVSNYKLYNTTIIDVCSVKVYPVQVMEETLPDHVGIIASHPHFGPDSYSPFRELKTTLFPVRDTYNRFAEIKQFFESQSIRTVELSPKEHDMMAASSQGITHFIGRVLNEAGVVSTQINTLGFTELLGVIEQTCNDSWDLFRDLQKYNPYTNEMIDKLVEVIEKLHGEIKADED
ncbi:MAG: prephenate dehydrogenase/arogenate dehydrogenase family protein [Candidatus Marinimicrobia bacterium]|jgi:prephenate dehydrogenase|nr:prephenate dehydrogenase/arogenate dehydrogenase family protein [Candidatus Neomarinimicrobiota bacterium]MDP6852786.1 prephenate dehydrogenase/arogenate dehydrogenase family protein [Candidatus Neomarinimicrobiota bacterium]MDP6936445.1 prephenate dehydrogenase/arogenate dehydrogenase family protein [Candidatus Neomarinimicrobiota bacterium]